MRQTLTQNKTISAKHLYFSPLSCLSLSLSLSILTLAVFVALETLLEHSYRTLISFSSYSLSLPLSPFWSQHKFSIKSNREQVEHTLRETKRKGKRKKDDETLN